MTRRLLISLAGGGAAFSAPPAPSEFEIVAEPGGGGWTEVAGPHAVYADGNTYIGWTGGNSKPKDIEVAVWDGATLSAPTLLHNALADGVEGAPDSHEGPGMLVLPDGKVLAVYMGHGAGTFRSRRSTSAGDISAFETEETQSLSGLCTYAQVSYITSSDRIYVTYRSEAGTSYQVRHHSDDHGDSWSAGTQFYSTGNNNHYSATACDGEWMHFAVTNDDPNEADVGLWYFKMSGSDGNIYAADDTLLETSLPATPADLTELVDAVGGDAFPYSLSFTDDGRPVIACQTKKADPVEIFEFRWSGAAWERHDIATSDPISPSILSVGGGCHVWNDSERFITSRMDGADLIVSEYRSTDDGATWSHFADYGSGSSPVYVRDGVDIVALWFAPASSFTGSHDFDPGLAGVA